MKSSSKFTIKGFFMKINSVLSVLGILGALALGGVFFRWLSEESKVVEQRKEQRTSALLSPRPTFEMDVDLTIVEFEKLKEVYNPGRGVCDCFYSFERMRVTKSFFPRFQDLLQDTKDRYDGLMKWFFEKYKEKAISELKEEGRLVHSACLVGNSQFKNLHVLGLRLRDYGTEEDKGLVVTTIRHVVLREARKEISTVLNALELNPSNVYLRGEFRDMLNDADVWQFSPEELPITEEMQKAAVR